MSFNYELDAGGLYPSTTEMNRENFIGAYAHIKSYNKDKTHKDGEIRVYAKIKDKCSDLKDYITACENRMTCGRFMYYDNKLWFTSNNFGYAYEESINIDVAIKTLPEIIRIIKDKYLEHGGLEKCPIDGYKPYIHKKNQN